MPSLNKTLFVLILAVNLIYQSLMKQIFQNKWIYIALFIVMFFTWQGMKEAGLCFDEKRFLSKVELIERALSNSIGKSDLNFPQNCTIISMEQIMVAHTQVHCVYKASADEHRPERYVYSMSSVNSCGKRLRTQSDEVSQRVYESKIAAWSSNER